MGKGSALKSTTPSPLLAGTPLHARDGDGTLVSLPFRRVAADGSSTLLGMLNFRFNLDLPPAHPPGDASLIIGQLMALISGDPLRVQAPVSPSLLARSPRFLEIHQSFHPDETIIPVEATAAPEPALDSARGVGVFLSNGVDSWHAILESRPEITHYIFILGFDIWLKHHDYAARATALARATAERLGRPLIIVETNFFDFAHHYITWPRGSQPMQAAITSLLSPLLRKVIIAADFPWSQLHAGAEHPHFYKHLSADHCPQVSIGAASTRQAKLEGLCAQPEWLPYLRVCWDMTSDLLNCGRCEKCLRTMTGLFIAGAAEHCPVLPPLDPALLDGLNYSSKSNPFYENLLAAAEARPHLPANFTSSLRRCVERNQLNALVEELQPFRRRLASASAYRIQEKNLRDRLFDLLAATDLTWVLKKLRRHSRSYRQDVAKTLRKIDKPLLRRTQRQACWQKFLTLFRRGSKPSP